MPAGLTLAALLASGPHPWLTALLVVGLLVVGLIFQAGGLALMLGTATGFLALSALAAGRLRPEPPGRP